jgi:hypothetical protein
VTYSNSHWFFFSNCDLFFLFQFIPNFPYSQTSHNTQPIHIGYDVLKCISFSCNFNQCNLPTSLANRGLLFNPTLHTYIRTFNMFNTYNTQKFNELCLPSLPKPLCTYLLVPNPHLSPHQNSSIILACKFISSHLPNIPPINSNFPSPTHKQSKQTQKWQTSSLVKTLPLAIFLEL